MASPIGMSRMVYGSRTDHYIPKSSYLGTTSKTKLIESSAPGGFAPANTTVAAMEKGYSHKPHINPWYPSESGLEYQRSRCRPKKESPILPLKDVVNKSYWSLRSGAISNEDREEERDGKYGVEFPDGNKIVVDLSQPLGPEQYDLSDWDGQAGESARKESARKKSPTGEPSNAELELQDQARRRRLMEQQEMERLVQEESALLARTQLPQGRLHQRREARGKLLAQKNWVAGFHVLDTERAVLMSWASWEAYFNQEPMRNDLDVSSITAVQSYSEDCLQFELHLAIYSKEALVFKAENIVEATKWVQAFKNLLSQDRSASSTSSAHARSSRSPLSPRSPRSPRSPSPPRSASRRQRQARASAPALSSTMPILTLKRSSRRRRTTDQHEAEVDSARPDLAEHGRLGTTFSLLSFGGSREDVFSDMPALKMRSEQSLLRDLDESRSGHNSHNNSKSPSENGNGRSPASQRHVTYSPDMDGRTLHGRISELHRPRSASLDSIPPPPPPAEPGREDRVDQHSATPQTALSRTRTTPSRYSAPSFKSAHSSSLKEHGLRLSGGTVGSASPSRAGPLTYQSTVSTEAPTTRFHCGWLEHKKLKRWSRRYGLLDIHGGLLLHFNTKKSADDYLVLGEARRNESWQSSSIQIVGSQEPEEKAESALCLDLHTTQASVERYSKDQSFRFQVTGLRAKCLYTSTSLRVHKNGLETLKLRAGSSMALEGWVEALSRSIEIARYQPTANAFNGTGHSAASNVHSFSEYSGTAEDRRSDDEPLHSSADSSPGHSPGTLPQPLPSSIPPALPSAPVPVPAPLRTSEKDRLSTPPRRSHKTISSPVAFAASNTYSPPSYRQASPSQPVRSIASPQASARTVEVFLDTLDGEVMGLARVGDTPARACQRLGHKRQGRVILDRYGVTLLEDEQLTAEDGPYVIVPSRQQEK